MRKKTTEFSFVVRPTKYGVGVFAVHDIKAGTFLRMFGDAETWVMRPKKDIPTMFRQYCLDRNDKMWAPADFGHMEIGCYINHSKTPNAHHKKYQYYALRDIRAGEEITIDYNTLEEPEEAKEDYYK
jgi:SET domain-containing protein